MTEQPTLGKQIRIAIVDDHPMARDWTRAALQAIDDMTVIGVAEDGASGLKLISDEMPDVVVLDLHLPDMSGVEVARRVRAAIPEMAIVVVTGFDDPAYAQALLQLGVRGYLTKSTSAAELVFAVHEAVAGRTIIHSDAARNAVALSELVVSTKERKLLALLASGRRNPQIADALGISLTVVEYQIGQLLQRLGARSRAEAIQTGYELGIAPPMSTFVDGTPAGPPLKLYHGQGGSTTRRCTVQVQEGSDFHILGHDCKLRHVVGCQSASGWDYGFAAYGGVELARWLLADCLGESVLEDNAVLYAFKSALLNHLSSQSWMISETEIRTWAADSGLERIG